MKKPLLNSIKITAALSLLLGVPLLVTLNKEAGKVDAYSTSSLPTTIYLGDADSNKIKEYYESLNDLSTSERQGTNLLKHLKTILKTDQKYYGYPSDLTWNMYEIIDRDWTKSPKESISTSGTYDSSSNSFKNYKYGSSYDNPYVRILYVKRNLDNGARAYGDHTQTSNYGFNREHIWPKSHGFNNEGASNGGALGDPHHLWAGQGHANNIHSNYFYGYVNTSSTYTDCGSSYPTVAGNYKGTSKTIGSGTVFEPQDSDKGDIARAVFYMAARYNSWAGSSSDTFDSCNPNLILSTDLSQNDTTGSSTSSTKYSLGLVQDLLNWNRIDPPDEYEIHRNNLVYYNYGGNRNPFIDYPEWAEFIWGKSTYNGNTYQSYSSTPTGYATPESDTINGYNGGGSSDPVAVTGVTLNTNSTSVEVGSDVTLTPTVAPINATNQGVTWSTSNASIATVSGGLVTGVSEGTVTITVTTSDGGFTATCTVTVTGSSTPTPVDGSATIAYGDTFSPTFPTTEASVNTSDTSHTDSTSNFAFKEQGIYKGSSNSYLMFVKDKGFLYNTSDLGTIDSVSVTYSSGTSTTGKVGVYFGTSQQSTYTTSSNQTIKGQSQTDTFTNSTNGKGYFQLSTSNKNVQITQIVVSYHTGSSAVKTLDSITLDTEDVEKEFYVGDEFNYDELGVTANYSDGTSDIVSPTSVSSPDMSTTGQKTVTVSYTEGGVTKTATYQITVVAAPTKELESISLSGSYSTTFVKNGTFSHEGMTVTANFSDSTNIDVTDSASFTGYNMATLGNQTVTVSYTYEGVTKTATYSITISNESGTSTNPYTVSEARTAIDNASGSTISNKYTIGYIYNVASYSSNYHSITYWISDDGTGSTSSYDGIQVFGGKGIDGADFSAKTELQVGDKVLVSGSLTFYNNTTYEYSSSSSIISLTRMSSLSVSGQTTSYDVGDSFSFDGTATLTYSDSTNKNVTTSVSCSAPDMSTSGTKTITVSYTEFGGTISTTYQITVSGSGGDITTNSQKVVSSSSSEYYEEGSLVLSLSNNTATASCDAFTITQTKVSGSSAVTLSYDEIRVYSGHSLAITPSSGYVITSIELTTDSEGYASAVGGSSLTNCTKTTSSNLVTLTPTDGSSAVSFLNSAQSRIRYVVVNFEELIVQTYTLVTDPTTLGTGDEVIFVGNKNDSSYYQNKTVEANGSGYYLRTAQGEAPSNNVIKLADSTSPLLLEKTNGLFRFKQADGTYLAAYDNSSSNYLGYESAQSLTDKSLFSLAINNSNGKVTSLMSQTTSLTHKYVLFNGSSYWFGCYSSNSNSYSYHIFKKTSQVDADTWSNTFLLTTENCTMTVNQWDQLGTSYGSLSKSAKEEIINCIANDSTDYCLRSQAMARYEYILSDARFNTGLSNFIAGRNVSEARGNITALLSLKNSQSLIIIVIISTISVSAIGGYFFFKSRRKDNF